MAARFPQSSTSVAYQLTSTYSSKIKALYWAATADSVHRLRPGDTATTILTRSSSSASFNSTDGRISGSFNGTSYFTDQAASGSYFSAANNDCVLVTGIYGDIGGSGVPNLGGNTTHVAVYGGAYSSVPFTTFPGIKLASFTVNANNASNVVMTHLTGFSDGSNALNTFAFRYLAADGTARNRCWRDGAELTAIRDNTAGSGSTSWGDSTNPITFGASYNSSGTNLCEWEFAMVGLGTFTDGELDTITGDPTVLLEATPAGGVLIRGVKQLTGGMQNLSGGTS
jgi:hypothetical protein